MSEISSHSEAPSARFSQTEQGAVVHFEGSPESIALAEELFRYLVFNTHNIASGRDNVMALLPSSEENSLLVSPNDELTRQTAEEMTKSFNQRVQYYEEIGALVAVKALIKAQKKS